MKNNTPINYQIVKQEIEATGLEKIGRASIRELVRLINRIEAKSGRKFIRMEMGVPGLDASKIGIAAEINALNHGVASKYPMIEGISELKNETARFAKLFIDIDVKPESCVPTVGSMQASFTVFLITGRMHETKTKNLFIDPGFPVQKQQLAVLGMPFETFDVYNFRGEKLREKLESYLSKGNIASILYSNPNNPSWICFTNEELKIIGELATKYDVVVIEDLAYFAMDFRNDYSIPGKAPYQPTVAKYTDNYVLLLSSSKVFSYAGQRVGALIISDNLYERKFSALKRFYKSDGFGYTLIYGALYALSAGVCHSAQHAMAAMLKAANDGKFEFIEAVKEYGQRAKTMKKLFVENGFELVYDKDIDRELADGFYFTFSYRGFSGEELLEKLLYYGISAIALDITGSSQTQGLRACVSQTSKKQFTDLETRLKQFNADFGS